MKKILLFLPLCFLLTSCSLIPRITYDKAGTTPTSTNKSKKVESCAGEYKLDKDNDMIFCSKGYKNFEQDYSQKERAYTLAEKVGNFFRGLVGWSFWGVVILIFLCPSLLGLIAGRLLEGVYGIGAKAFKQVSTAIQKVKDTSPSLVDALEKSTDTDVRVWIEDFKKKNNIK